MNKLDSFPAQLFDQAGLNRQHVFKLADLPADILPGLGDHQQYSQLILLGHGGKKLWACVQAAGMTGEHPIDDYTIQTCQAIFAEHFPKHRYHIIYPGPTAVGLQALGKLAGWHHSSPFMLGIDADWGSWFAYRAAILIDTHFAASLPVDRRTSHHLPDHSTTTPLAHPCHNCLSRPCVGHCPGEALANEDGDFALDKCINYRRQAGSACRTTCLSRIACPVGTAHRYNDDQMQHTYALSLAAIEKYYEKKLGS